MLKDQLTNQQWFAIAWQKSAEGIVGGILPTKGLNKSDGNGVLKVQRIASGKQQTLSSLFYGG